MISISLFALLIASTQVQPANAESTEISAPTTSTVEAATTAQEAETEEPLICRSRLIPSYRTGQRFSRQRTCMTRAEWRQADRNGRN